MLTSNDKSRLYICFTLFPDRSADFFLFLAAKNDPHSDRLWNHVTKFLISFSKYSRLVNGLIDSLVFVKPPLCLKRYERGE